MTTPVHDLSVTPAVLSMLACLQAEVATVRQPPAVTALRPGSQVTPLLSTMADECCTGLAWVRVVGMYPSENFPLADERASNCGPLQWAVVLELGVARCAPTPPANALVSDEEWNQLSLDLLDDAAAMRRAVCCFAQANPDQLYLPRAWTPLAVDGGCVGATHQVVVAVPDCDCVTD